MFLLTIIFFSVSQIVILVLPKLSKKFVKPPFPELFKEWSLINYILSTSEKKYPIAALRLYYSLMIGSIIMGNITEPIIKIYEHNSFATSLFDINPFDIDLFTIVLKIGFRAAIAGAIVILIFNHYSSSQKWQKSVTYGIFSVTIGAVIWVLVETFTLFFVNIFPKLGILILYLAKIGCAMMFDLLMLDALKLNWFWRRWDRLDSGKQS